MSRPKPPALIALDESGYEKLYHPDDVAKIADMVDLYAPPQTPAQLAENPAILRDAEMVFSGWGAPRFDEALLAAAAHLKVVFYAAGSVRGVVSEAFWQRGVIICSAWGANAIPVAEYSLAQILMCLKSGYRHARLVKTERTFRRGDVAGAYHSTVGIISLGMIGRRVGELLRPFDLRVIAYDPFVKQDEATALGVEMVSLEEVFRRADVVSLHTPNLPETRGMITGEHFRSMKPNSGFVNSARGAVVREDEMIEVLRTRPDIQAVLDVTHPEPPAADSPLYELENVVLTPHIAGSLGPECRRHCHFMIEECRRYLRGEPLRWSISREQAAKLA